MKPFISKYGGILIGAVYALFMRLIFGYALNYGTHSFFDLFSITFIWIVPVLIGITPLLLATKQQLKSGWFSAGRPIVTVLVFFFFCLISRIEDVICILIIALPFCIAAAIGGALFAQVVIHFRRRMGIVYSLYLIPFITGFTEQQLPTPTKIYVVKTVVVINAIPDTIWSNIVRVSPIKKEEYQRGLFNYAGIPKPLYASLDKDTIGATRIGHFEGGLIFKEHVIAWKKNERIALDIQVIPSSIRNTVFDQHVLKGQHFKFLNAVYTINPVNTTQTSLTLTSSYQLDTRINGYGAFWGNALLTDFQERLVHVIKQRCDKTPK